MLKCALDQSNKSVSKKIVDGIEELVTLESDNWPRAILCRYSILLVGIMVEKKEGKKEGKGREEKLEFSRWEWKTQGHVI